MKLLQQHIHNISESMSSRFQMTSISSHSGNIGTARELVVKDLLKDNLPSNIAISTGEAFDSNDDKSGQLDIIIHSTSTPKLTVQDNIKILPIDGIICAIECKSNLTTGSMAEGASHLKSALDSCVKFKSLKRINPIGIGSDYLREKGLSNHISTHDLIGGIAMALHKTPFMIFAINGPSPETLREKLLEYQQKNNIDLESMPDVITVLSKEYYFTRNNGWLFPKAPGNVHWSQGASPNSTILGMYLYLSKLIEAELFRHKFFPITDYIR